MEKWEEKQLIPVATGVSSLNYTNRFVVIVLMMDEDDIIWDKASSETLFQEEAAEGAQLKPLKMTASIVCEYNAWQQFQW